jgi:hypothetical protein
MSRHAGGAWTMRAALSSRAVLFCPFRNSSCKRERVEVEWQHSPRLAGFRTNTFVGEAVIRSQHRSNCSPSSESRRFGRLSARCAHTKSPHTTVLLWRSLRAFNRPGGPGQCTSRHRSTPDNNRGPLLDRLAWRQKGRALCSKIGSPDCPPPHRSNFERCSRVGLQFVHQQTQCNAHGRQVANSEIYEALTPAGVVACDAHPTAHEAARRSGVLFAAACGERGVRGGFSVTGCSAIQCTNQYVYAV